MVKDTTNPFENKLDPYHLFNIGTVGAASDKAEKFLLSVDIIGEKKQKELNQGVR